MLWSVYCETDAGSFTSAMGLPDERVMAIVTAALAREGVFRISIRRLREPRDGDDQRSGAALHQTPR